jgi:putative Ca2+/H+ antiporter (TMEM165/GDT1 family)
VSEIGDKTFFIAGLLAAKYSRFIAFTGSVGNQTRPNRRAIAQFFLPQFEMTNRHKQEKAQAISLFLQKKKT